MSEYTKKANEFAVKHKIQLGIIGEPEYRKYFDSDKDKRYVFKMHLSRKGKSYTFTFGQSIANDAEPPNMYDILACITKSDPGSFHDFCGDFGYDEDSRKAEKIYHSVVKEWKAVKRLFGDIIDELQDIQ